MVWPSTRHHGRRFIDRRDPDWGTGLGKGLLSVVGRGGLGAGACFAGSGCSQLTGAAFARLLTGLSAGAVLDSVFLAHRSVERPTRMTLQLVPSASLRFAGAEVMGAW
jgi:hypothetical protein